MNHSQFKAFLESVTKYHPDLVGAIKRAHAVCYESIDVNVDNVKMPRLSQLVPDALNINSGWHPVIREIKNKLGNTVTVEKGGRGIFINCSNGYSASIATLEGRSVYGVLECAILRNNSIVRQKMTVNGREFFTHDRTERIQESDIVPFVVEVAELPPYQEVIDNTVYNDEDEDDDVDLTRFDDDDDGEDSPFRGAYEAERDEAYAMSLFRAMRRY